MPLFKKSLLLFAAICVHSISMAQSSDSLSTYGDSTTTTMKEVVVVGKNPISEKFSVTQISKLDIYFNPLSKGDPLNAIQILPASTNVDETANPVLRGGTADRSRVYINGSAVLNPVRNAQNTGLGNFSLLNTEIINKQYVYASNPPLTYSNSSAGLIEIETNKNLENDNLQISTALSNVGIMLNKKIDDRIFFQIYSNRQFSNFLKEINNTQLPDLKHFSSTDAGLNTRIRIHERISFNSFNYYVNENYKSEGYYLNYKGNSQASQKRFFSINNIDYISGRSKIRLSTMYDYSNKSYQFGLIDSRPIYNIFTTSLSHKYAVSNTLTLQYGLDFANQQYTFNETLPVYHFSHKIGAPVYHNLEPLTFRYAEVYLYGDYKLNKDLGVSGGVRQNVYTSNDIKKITSFQLSAFYNLNRYNRFIFGIGNYNSYSTPNYIQHTIGQLNSQQIALDYYLEKKKYTLTVASFYKIDKGHYQNTNIEFFDKIINLGVEASINYNLSKYLSLGISNIFLNQKGYLGDEKYNTANNLRYFIKSQIIYNNPKLFTTSLSFTTRPGNYYSNVSNTTFDTITNDFQPFFYNTNEAIYNNYYRIDFTLNKMFNIKGNSLIAFLTINNLLNTKNQAIVYYNNDYSNTNFQYYQQRIIYVGFQLRLNNLKFN